MNSLIYRIYRRYKYEKKIEWVGLGDATVSAVLALQAQGPA